jgi:hypothetical protein
VEADLRVILERLADPHTPAAEKAVIRDMLHFLASRRPSSLPAPQQLSA